MKTFPSLLLLLSLGCDPLPTSQDKVDAAAQKYVGPTGEVLGCLHNYMSLYACDVRLNPGEPSTRLTCKEGGCILSESQKSP